MIITYSICQSKSYCRDGSLCIWSVTTAREGEDSFGEDGGPSKRPAFASGLTASPGGYEYASEILITKTELEEKNRLVYNLQQQVGETR